MQTEYLASCSLCGSTELAVPDSRISFVQCSNCNYVFDNPRPVLDDIVTYYSKNDKYDNWINDIVDREYLWKRRLKKLKNYDAASGSLLDVGAGIGQFMHVASDTFSEVCGTEVSASAISIAKERYGFDLYKGVIEDIDFGGKKFDVITLFHVLEHVPNPRDTLESCYKNLAVNGIVVVAVPNDLQNIKNKIKYLLTLTGIKTYTNFNKYMLPEIKLDGTVDEIHLSHFYPKTLCRLFNSVGLKVIDLTLDPHYVVSGLALMKKNIYFFLLNFVNSIFRLNLYETTWIVGKKVSN